MWSLRNAGRPPVAIKAMWRRTRLGLFGPLSAFGLAVAAIACALDQATKLFLLRVIDLARIGVVTLTSMVDLQLVWNPGISYGLFQHGSPQWQWALLAIKVVAIVLLWTWLAHARARMTAVALGLIIGGAFGNAIDRLAYGAVMDFVHFHVGGFSWYVFNVADSAIVIGVAGLFYGSFAGEDAGRAASQP
jgi:signal peptidase II